MIKEGYLAKMKSYPESDLMLVVMRWHPRYHSKGFLWVPDLAPSSLLLTEYKAGRMDWEPYEKHYRNEMDTLKAQNLILHYAEKARKGQVIRLLCIERDPPCHRFILKDIMEEDEGGN